MTTQSLGIRSDVVRAASVSRVRRWRRHWAAALLVAMISALAIASERGKSWTADEDVHLIRGLSYWWVGDTRFNFAHPPLANALQAAPSAVLDEKFDLSSLSGWRRLSPVRLSHQWARRDFELVQHQVWRGRMVTVGFFAALCGLVYWLGMRLWGRKTGLVALVFVGANTAMLAHARLLTTDIPAVFASSVLLAATVRYVRQTGAMSWVWLCLSACLACLTKHSGLVLVAMSAAVVLATAGLGKLRFSGESLGPRVARPLRDFAAIGLVVLLAINAAYGFQRTGWRVDELIAEKEPTSWLRRRNGGDLLDNNPVFSRLPPQLRIPLPMPYLVGLATIAKQNSLGHGGYFAGKARKPGHVAYFPVMLAIKLPVGLLAMFAVGVVAVLRRRVRLSATSAVIAGFGGLYLAAAMRSDINIGVRHVLPFVPVMALLAARSATWLLERVDSMRVRTAVLASVLSVPGGALIAFPHYIGDFNVLVGGPRGGLYVNVIGEDWGQDTAALADHVLESGKSPLYYYTNFTLRRFELSERGVDVRKFSCKKRPPPGGLIAIQRSDWVRKPGCFRWLREREPDATVARHLYVFDNGAAELSSSRR
ncbi:MAG: hypothetical protein B7733_23205 [Myxococcales bacterium FL481]|nr:MAG: hypothetical protein B7733_23205 [Myxococcales bacterium FL481]